MLTRRTSSASRRYDQFLRAVEFKWRILANAFFGETPNGDWQIDVFDGAIFDAGSLEAWRLQFHYGTHPSDDDDDDTGAVSTPSS